MKHLAVAVASVSLLAAALLHVVVTGFLLMQAAATSVGFSVDLSNDVSGISAIGAREAVPWWPYAVLLALNVLLLGALAWVHERLGRVPVAVFLVGMGAVCVAGPLAVEHPYPWYFDVQTPGNTAVDWFQAGAWSPAPYAVLAAGVVGALWRRRLTRRGPTRSDAA